MTGSSPCTPPSALLDSLSSMCSAWLPLGGPGPLAEWEGGQLCPGPGFPHQACWLGPCSPAAPLDLLALDQPSLPACGPVGSPCTLAWGRPLSWCLLYLGHLDPCHFQGRAGHSLGLP